MPKLEEPLRSKALALITAVIDEDEPATDAALDALPEDEAEEVQEALGLADHLLDIHLGISTGCLGSGAYTEEYGGKDEPEDGDGEEHF